MVTYIYVAFHKLIIIGLGNGATSCDSFGVRHVDVEFCNAVWGAYLL